MTESRVYLAGVGISPWPWLRASLPSLQTDSATLHLAISAATKALLDAGLSYDSIDRSVCSENTQGSFDALYALGKTGVPIHQIDRDSALLVAAHFIRSGAAQSVLLVNFDEAAAASLVLVSRHFLSRHPFLMDSAVLLDGQSMRSSQQGSSTARLVVHEALRKANLQPSDVHLVESNAHSALDELEIPRNIPIWSAASNLSGLCELVWLLRGWMPCNISLQHCLQFTSSTNGVTKALILSRSDGHRAPSYENIQFKNDGRDRLGYNPAQQNKDITMEDWQAVKSRSEFSTGIFERRLRFRRKGGDYAALEKL